MFVSLFIALVFFRLIAAGAGESFSALDLSPGFFSGVFFLHLQAGLVCVLRLRVFGTVDGAVLGCACRRVLAMRAQMIRARAGEARDARDIRSLVVLWSRSMDPFHVWNWNHCNMWTIC